MSKYESNTEEQRRVDFKNLLDPEKYDLNSEYHRGMINGLLLGYSIAYEPYGAEVKYIDPKPTEQNFTTELRSLINRYSKENGSDTPDFILATYLSDCLEAFNKTMRDRAVWYGKGSTQSHPTVGDLGSN